MLVSVGEVKEGRQETHRKDKEEEEREEKEMMPLHQGIKREEITRGEVEKKRDTL